MSSKKSKLIIEHIVDRFLNPKMGYDPNQFKSISEILELPIYALKNVSLEDAEAYKKVLHVSNLREIARLDYDHPLNLLIPPQRGDDIELHLEKCEQILSDARIAIGNEEKLKGSILIATMISQAWVKRASYLKKKDTKVITVGLANAGKTAILSSLGGKMGLDSLANLKPTKRIERRKIQTDSLDLFLWDFGGQADYREMYINEPEKYFLGTDLIIYVIDMQDQDKYDSSFDYFSQILKIMVRLSEKPYILCFMHKADPDLLSDPDFKLQQEYVKDHLKDIMKDYPFDYDIYSTSIYNFFTSEPRFSKYIKDVMRDQQSLNDPMLEKMEGIGKILDTTLNAVVNLASSVGEQIASLDFRINQMQNDIDQLKQNGFASKEIKPRSIISKPPPPPNAMMQQIEAKAVATRNHLNQIQANSVESMSQGVVDQSNQTRTTILTELRALFQKTKKE